MRQYAIIIVQNKTNKGLEKLNDVEISSCVRIQAEWGIYPPPAISSLATDSKLGPLRRQLYSRLHHQVQVQLRE